MRNQRNQRSTMTGTALLTAAVCISLFITGCKRTPNADVVATVNGHPLMKADLEKYYTNQLGDAQQQPSPEQADNLRLNLLHQMIDDEIMQQRAVKLGLQATDEEVDAKLAEVKAPYTQEEFDARLEGEEHHRRRPEA